MSIILLMVLQVVDMLDHHPDSKIQYAVKDGQFQLTAHTRVQQVGTAQRSLNLFDVSAADQNMPHQGPVAHAQGQTMYISYGHKSNEELLLGYGFVLPHNVANFVKVAISPASTRGASFLLQLPSLADMCTLRTDSLNCSGTH